MCLLDSVSDSSVMPDVDEV